PLFEEQQIPLLRVLTDRGTEYCGKAEYHEYELYLTIEGIEHSKTKVKSPQSNGICERFHRTIQEEFYAVAFRKKLYTSIEELQKDLDEWLDHYNRERSHSGKYCYGRTPWETFLASKDLAQRTMLNVANDQHLTRPCLHLRSAARVRVAEDLSRVSGEGFGGWRHLPCL